MDQRSESAKPKPKENKLVIPNFPKRSNKFRKRYDSIDEIIKIEIEPRQIESKNTNRDMRE